MTNQHPASNSRTTNWNDHVVVAALPLLPLAVLVPAAIFFPYISISALAVSALIAIAAWHCVRADDPDRMTLWDLSGACALIGVAAALFEDARPVLDAIPRP